MKDPYKRLSSEWGSKARKADSRAAKSTLKKPTREELAEAEQESIMERTREAMANPKKFCERCDIYMTQYNRQWDGNRWVCDKCAEETAR